MDVGFVGLGHMGQAMARNLLKAGHRVTVHNRSRDKAEALAADGAKVAASRPRRGATRSSSPCSLRTRRSKR